VRDAADLDLVRRRTGLEVAAALPWDEALAEAERLGRAPLDHAPGSPAVRVLESMADRFEEERLRGAGGTGDPAKRSRTDEGGGRRQGRLR
jgi:CO dehydrogenase maturation factor